MRTLCWIIALAMALGILWPAALSEDAQGGYDYHLGDTIEDFTVTTCDGREISLYGLLEEKEMVLINIWATWCGPCRSEFPYLEEAYEEYADRVGVIALSCEPTDTDEVLSAFAAQMGMTFPVARDTPDLSARFGVTGIPTSVVVDRFGTICFVEAGSQPNTDAFRKLFRAFLGDAYTESVLLDGLPKDMPDIEPSTPEALAEALNVEGGSLVFANGADAYEWPMLAGEKDGRRIAVSANAGRPDSAAVVNTTVEAQAGDALCVGFKVSSESGFDLMEILIDGEIVKAFGGERDWMTYAYPFAEAGAYDVSIRYVKDEAGSQGEDTLWLDSVALLSGDEAAAALAANPVYPVSDALYARVTNESARRIVIDDPTGYVTENYGDLFYIVGDDVVWFELGLPAQYDPERAIVSFNYDGSAYALTDLIADGRYVVSCGGDSLETTGYCDSGLFLYPSIQEYWDFLTLTYLKSEADADVLVGELTKDENGVALGGWTYEDASLPARETGDDGEAANEAAFSVLYVDQDGNPVPGAMLQVCDDYSCTVYVSDEDGLCAFTLAPGAWELHTLKVPAGYTGDTETVTVSGGGAFVFTLTRQ